MTELMKSLNYAATAASDADRDWFKHHPDAWQCIRPLVTGEFDRIGLGSNGSVAEAAVLAPPPAGRQWCTVVSVVTQDRTARVRLPAVFDAGLREPQATPVWVVSDQLIDWVKGFPASRLADWLRQYLDATEGGQR